MGIWKRNLENKKNVVVLDIGSQFLKAVLMEIDKKEGKGIIKGWAREPLQKNLEESCKKIIEKTEKSAKIKAEQIFLGMNSDLIKGISATVCYRRENPKQKIDLSELKFLVQKVQWRAFDNIRKTFALETNLPDTDVRLINANIISIKIDEHSIHDPLGFEGESFCLTIFNNYTSVEKLKEILFLTSNLNLELIGINSSSYAICDSLNSESQNKDFILIDIGGKTTEITLVRKHGETINTENFHLGGNLFSKTIADFLEVGTNESELIKIKYSKGEISNEAKKKIKEILIPNISCWANGVKVLLEEFLKKYGVLPKKVFLSGEASLLPGIKETLEKKGLIPEFILPREIIKIKNKTKFQEIPCLALANLSLEFPKNNLFAPLLKRVIRLIQD